MTVAIFLAIIPLLGNLIKEIKEIATIYKMKKRLRDSTQTDDY
jgi:hypothetical protein